MKQVILCLSMCMFVSPTLAGDTELNVQLKKGDNKVDIMIGGKLFTSYVYNSEMIKPVLVPVKTPVALF